MLHPERYKPGCNVLAIVLLTDVVHKDRRKDRETFIAQPLQGVLSMQTGRVVCKQTHRQQAGSHAHRQALRKVEMQINRKVEL